MKGRYVVAIKKAPVVVVGLCIIALWFLVTVIVLNNIESSNKSKHNKEYLHVGDEVETFQCFQKGIITEIDKTPYGYMVVIDPGNAGRHCVADIQNVERPRNDKVVSAPK